MIIFIFMYFITVFLPGCYEKVNNKKAANNFPVLTFLLHILHIFYIHFY